MRTILLGCLVLGYLIASTTGSSAQKPSVKSQKMLSPAAAGAPGASISCNILTNGSLQVQGTNTSNKTYQCDVTCNLKTDSGGSANFNCTPALPANTTNGDLCDSTGPFSEITGGKFTCQ
jgi:hypothetical protein